jgi:MerR family regulatory protein
MRIGELSARAGVSVRALRYYEEIAELLPCVSGDRDQVVPGDGLIDSLRVEHDRISRQIAEMTESLRVLEGVIEAGTAR